VFSISPLGKNPLTLTTTLTFPPGEGLEGLIPCVDTITLSRDLNDGLDAVDCCCIIIIADDIMDILVAAVLPLIPEAPEIELVDECANC
jgi:hypothetical protein